MEALLLHHPVSGAPFLVNWDNVLTADQTDEGVMLVLVRERHIFARESLDDLMRIMGQPKVLGDRT